MVKCDDRMTNNNNNNNNSDQIKKNDKNGVWGVYGGKNRLEDLGIDGDNIKMDLQEVGWEYGEDWSGSRQGQVAGLFECGNKPPDSMKG